MHGVVGMDVAKDAQVGCALEAPPGAFKQRALKIPATAVGDAQVWQALQQWGPPAASLLGLEAPYSADYLTTWGTTPDVLRAQLDAVSRAASHIIQALQPTGKADEDPAAEEVA